MKGSDEMLMALGILVSYILFFLICLVRYTSYHLRIDLNISSFYQIIFNMQVGMDGAEEVWQEAIDGFFAQYGAALLIMGFLAICALVPVLKNAWIIWKRKDRSGRPWKELLRSPEKNRYRQPKLLRTSVLSVLAASLVALLFQSGYELDRLGYFDYVQAMNSDSNFYEQNYVDPQTTQITFPQKKKNLVYIFMESMEKTFASEKRSGFYDRNIIPNITTLTLEGGEDFSGSDVELQGARTTVNSTWTIAAMVTQTSGSPLVYFDKHEDTGGGYWSSSETPFLTNLYTLGNILQENGYSNKLLMGSPGVYAGRSNYFSQHGDYEIYDLDWARQNGITPTKDYGVFWGMEDKYLFTMAKQVITEAAAEDEPFNVTMLTVDTHFPDGYLCDLCPDPEEYGGDQMLAVIACSDRQIADFVHWIYDQPFGEDTTVILSGDHLSMRKEFQSEFEGYTRETFFTILNGPEYTGERREYTTLDLFPTTIAALGAQIEGDRLGLGANLYSKQPTLLESIGMENLDMQIPNATDWYVENVLKIPPDQEDGTRERQE